MKKADPLRLEVVLSPVQKVLVDELRGGEEPEVFLCRMVELGLTQLMISTAVFHKDRVIEELAEATIGDHGQARAMLFKVNKEATKQPPTTPEPTPEQSTNGIDPHPRHLPKGLR
jgi:hypothetical protein